MVARKGAGRKPAKNEAAAGLIKALDFMGVLKGPTGQQRMLYMDHVFMANGWAIGYDGVVAAGHRIDAEFNGYVNTKLLAEALANTSKQFTLTVQEGGHFFIESGSYQSLVPAISTELAIETYPDGNLENSYPIQPAFADALVIAGKVVSDNAEAVIHASIRTNGNSVMATDGDTVIEVWHGSHMPTGLLIPRLFANAVGKAIKLGKELVGFGVAPGFTTLTLHFSDQSWLRTNLYQSEWPAGIIEFFPNIFNGMVFADAPKGMFDAVRAVIPFAGDDGNILLRPGIVRTHSDTRVGASLEVKDVNFDIDVNGKTLLAIEDHATQLAINLAVPAMVFQGGNVRGAITGHAPRNEAPQMTVQEPESQGWGTAPTVAHNAEQPAAEPEQGGWGDFKVATVSPPAEEPKVEQTETKPRNQQVDAKLYNGLSGLPEGGLSQANFDDDHADDAFYDNVSDSDSGVDLVYDSQGHFVGIEGN